MDVGRMTRLLEADREESGEVSIRSFDRSIVRSFEQYEQYKQYEQVRAVDFSRCFNVQVFTCEGAAESTFSHAGFVSPMSSLLARRSIECTQ